MTLQHRTRRVLVRGALAVVLTLGGDVTSGHAGVRHRTGRIAFLRTIGDGPSRLYAIAPNGTDLRPLAPSQLDVSSFEWSPDGRRIAYLDRKGALRLVRADGTGGELIATNSPLRSPWSLSWSPDGKTVAVLAHDPGAPRPRGYSGDPYWIYLIPTGGGKPRRLSPDPAQELDWSSRHEIVFEGPRGIEVIRSDRSNARPFFSRPQTKGFGLATWSADGRQVGFASHVRHVHTTAYDWYDAIYVADADGKNLRLLTSHAYNEYGFAWSPDSREILYGREHHQGIYTIGADGRNNRRLTRDSPRSSGFPVLTWAPDGKSVAYETDRTGNGDLYVVDTDGHDKVQLTSSPASDIAPAWQPRQTP